MYFRFKFLSTHFISHNTRISNLLAAEQYESDAINHTLDRRQLEGGVLLR